MFASPSALLLRALARAPRSWDVILPVGGVTTSLLFVDRDEVASEAQAENATRLASSPVTKKAARFTRDITTLLKDRY